MRLLAIAALACGFAASAQADIWKWVDQFGNTHFVMSNRPIYTWVELGEVHFSDTPDHPDALRVTLVWHSEGTLEDTEATGDPNAIPGETPEQAAERRAAEAYYCSQAKDIYETYRSAPQLFKTQENGERQYLSVEEMAATLAEAKASVDQLCN